MYIAGQLKSSILNTGVSMDTLNQIATAMTTLPKDFSVHRGIKRVYDARRKMVKTGEGIDWATAEALAFGTLLAEGNHVRLSGQDVERGTFSHRHAILVDQKTGEKYSPLDHLRDEQGRICVHNSPLTESACLGYEYGYSLTDPRMLIVPRETF